MDEDWGATANAPSFSLFKQITPVEAVAQGGVVSAIIYQSWKKADRRLYQKLKYEEIVRQLERDQLKSIDDLSDAINSLNFFKDDQQVDTTAIDDLIDKIQSNLKLKSDSCAKGDKVKLE